MSASKVRRPRQARPARPGEVRGTSRQPGFAAPGPHRSDAWALAVVGCVVLLAVASHLHVLVWLDRHRIAGVVGGVGLGLAGAVGFVAFGGHGHGSKNGRPLGLLRTPRPEAGWAGPDELGPLLVRGSDVPGDRIVLGTLERPGRSIGRRSVLVAAEVRQSVLVVGPSQSGKTTGLAIPAILNWRGPVLATSVKTDLVRQTIEQRRRLGPVDVYDPTGVTGQATAGWSPLSAASTWHGAKRVAAAMCSVAREDGGMEDAGFWYASAEKLLAPLLLAAAAAGATMSDVVRWVDDQDPSEAMLALELAGEPDALRAARTSFAREDRQRSSVFATAETVVAAFSDPDVARSAFLTPIDPASLAAACDRAAGRESPAARAVAGWPTLYCCAPARDQERLRPVFVAVVREVVAAVFEASARLGQPLRPGLLVVLDEAANVAPLADLDTILATAAGHGISLVTIWQDMAQIEARYGRRWSTIVNNHRARLLCPGIADPLTLDHLSALIGEEERLETSTTTGGDGHWSRTEAPALRRLAPTGSLRRLSPDEAVAVYGALPPVKVRLRPG